MNSRQRKTESWDFLKELTHARVALGQVGDAVPTSELLNFRLAHSRARDSVWRPMDVEHLRAAFDFSAHGFELIEVESRCCDKQEFLLKPDLGRELNPRSRQVLSEHAPNSDGPDCALVIADGLSASAVTANAAEFVAAFLKAMTGVQLSLGAVVVAARHARVALGDQIAGLLKARSVVMLIGERPGLATAESLGVYFTLNPSRERTDADRNCISNIHAKGLPPKLAGAMAAHLVKSSLQLQVSGVDLKIEYAGFKLIQDGMWDLK